MTVLGCTAVKLKRCLYFQVNIIEKFQVTFIPSLLFKEWSQCLYYRHRVQISLTEPTAQQETTIS